MESPYSTSTIVKDAETRDNSKPSGRSTEFTAFFRLPYGSKYMCTSSFVADPNNHTPPEKIGAAVQYDIINFEPYKKFQKFFDMMYMF